MAESKIGLSLSLCVSDILAGNVGEEEVMLVVAGTARQPAEIGDLIENYSSTYWRGQSERGAAIARRLFEAGKVYQPRLDTGAIPCPVPKWIEAQDAWRQPDA